jgi:hypothetical protein
VNENKITPSDWLGVIRFDVPLVGFEPTTCPLVREALYPLSYSGTQWKDIFFYQFKNKIFICCGLDLNRAKTVDGRVVILSQRGALTELLYKPRRDAGFIF